MKHKPQSFAVFERPPFVVLSPIQAWVAVFTFFCNGMPYEYYFVVGPQHLTEQQARDTMESQHRIHEARKTFLEDVIIAPTIN